MTTMYPTLSNMANWLNNEFNDMLTDRWTVRPAATTPAINVKATDKEYGIELAAPGTTKEDFSVNIDDEGNLVIKMEHKEEKRDEQKKEHYLRREFAYSNYEQSLSLPDDVDREAITARVENGVLHVTLPRKEAKKPETKQIEIG